MTSNNTNGSLPCPADVCEDINKTSNFRNRGIQNMPLYDLNFDPQPLKVRMSDDVGYSLMEILNGS